MPSPGLRQIPCGAATAETPRNTRDRPDAISRTMVRATSTSPDFLTIFVASKRSLINNKKRGPESPRLWRRFGFLLRRHGRRGFADHETERRRGHAHRRTIRDAAFEDLLR